jgi:branched-subunit amino acid transport protein AzlD
MPDPHYLLTAVLVASAITWALRAVPFALLAPLRHSELIRFLGDHSPVGVMIALVGYTVRNIAWLDPAIALPILVSGAMTTGLQMWRSNLVLSLAGGTTVHVVLATTIAGGLGG